MVAGLHWVPYFSEKEADTRQDGVGVVMISVGLTVRLVSTGSLAAQLLLHTRDDLQDVLLQETLQAVAALLEADLLSCSAVLSVNQVPTLTEEHAVVLKWEALRSEVSDELAIKVVSTECPALLERLDSGIGGEEVLLANITGLALNRTVAGQGRRTGLGQGQNAAKHQPHHC